MDTVRLVIFVLMVWFAPSFYEAGMTDVSIGIVGVGIALILLTLLVPDKHNDRQGR